MSNVDEVMDSEALMIDEIPISLNCYIVSLTLPTIFKERPSRGRREAPDHRGRCRPQWSYHRIL